MKNKERTVFAAGGLIVSNLPASRAAFVRAARRFLFGQTVHARQSTQLVHEELRSRLSDERVTAARPSTLSSAVTSRRKE